ncbi:MAG TPA: hypothetical protein VF045_02450 [Acidimicrobiales bacterium]
MSAARRTAGTWGVAVALAVAVAATGCGVPIDDDARRIADQDVPFGLLDTTTSTTVPTATSTSVPA